MTIYKRHIGGHGKHTVYSICTEHKDGTTDELCRFDTLETATNVLRYIRGDILTREQIADAIQAIRTIEERKAHDVGYLKIYCDNCGGEWQCYHRDIKNQQIRQCPHCYAKIDPSTWKQITRAFGEMRDAEMELYKDHANHMPLFTVDFVSDTVYENAKHRDRTCEECESLLPTAVSIVEP